MKLFLKTAAIASALLLMTASAAMAVTYTEDTSGAEAHFTRSDKNPMGVDEIPDQRDNPTSDGTIQSGDVIYNYGFNKYEDTKGMVSVMIAKIGETDSAAMFQSAEDLKKVNTDKSAAIDFNNSVNIENVVYINQADPSDIGKDGVVKPADVFEKMNLKNVLAPGRYVMYIGTSSDLKAERHGETSPASEDNMTGGDTTDESGVYVEYFDVYDTGDYNKQAIGIEFEKARTGVQMQAAGVDCPAGENYHFSFVADVYKPSADYNYGMIFSYKSNGKVYNTKGYFVPAWFEKDILITGEPTIRFGLEYCGIPNDFEDFKAEGFIEKKGANE